MSKRIESISEFENVLNEISTLKAPGVSGGRIKLLKNFSVENVQDEDQIVQKLYSCCMATPNTHKLGTLYVVDAIVRSWIELNQSSYNNEVISEDSKEGTPSAGIYKFRRLINKIVDDAVSGSSTNPDIVNKIEKLITIWEKANTFEQSVIDQIKAKSFPSTTPPGSPPAARVSKQASTVSSSTASKDPAAVLKALANLTKKTVNSPPATQINKPLSPPVTNIPKITTNPTDPNAIFQLLQNINGGNNNNNVNSNTNINSNSSNSPPVQFQERSRNRDRERDDNNYNRRQRSRSPQRGGRNHVDTQVEPKSTHVEGEQNIPGNPHYRERRPFIDNTTQDGCIKVQSRTVFIGGVPHNMDERTLAQTLRPYAEVQSVILNNERKHAFVKVYSRQEAENVISALSQGHSSGLRARWGVGFGPRDCCDYTTGISTIPISRLTDSDKKWIVSAQWGGTAGMPLETGLFIEEPDIEVGVGISSKTMSQKAPSNSYGGPRSNDHGGYRNNNHRDNNGYNNNNHRDNGYNNNRDNGYNNNNNNKMNPNNIPLNFGNVFPPQSAPMPQMAPPMPMNNMGGPNPAMNPNNMAQMAQMMAAMTQMQQQQPQDPNQPAPDMTQMFQALAGMMNQQQQGGHR